jgi:hypothetical protein
MGENYIISFGTHFLYAWDKGMDEDDAQCLFYKLVMKSFRNF